MNFRFSGEMRGEPSELLSACRLWCPSPSCPLIDSYKINQHGLGKDGRLIRSARPFSTYGNIEQKEEWMIERPRGSLWYLILHKLKIQLIVQVPANDPRLPIHREDMEIIVHHLPFRQNMQATDSIPA